MRSNSNSGSSVSRVSSSAASVAAAAAAAAAAALPEWEAMARLPERRSNTALPHVHAPSPLRMRARRRCFNGCWRRTAGSRRIRMPTDWKPCEGMHAWMDGNLSRSWMHAHQPASLWCMHA
eukprot:296256-Chlamydomonas_euryale.AAC.5